MPGTSAVKPATSRNVKDGRLKHLPWTPPRVCVCRGRGAIGVPRCRVLRGNAREVRRRPRRPGAGRGAPQACAPREKVKLGVATPRDSLECGGGGGGASRERARSQSREAEEVEEEGCLEEVQE